MIVSDKTICKKLLRIILLKCHIPGGGLLGVVIVDIVTVVSNNGFVVGFGVAVF